MKQPAALPPIAKRQVGWFTRYIRFYLGRNFHGVHLLNLTQLDRLEGWPLMVCLNHPSWWDPLMGAYLSQRFFKDRDHYAPIAAAGLAKYRFFERIGFFGIDPGTRSGAFRFLEIGEAALRSGNGALWVTPQGHFGDVRDRPIQIQTGVGHLAQRLSRVAMLPVALEYAFWNERYAEAFACIGQPVFVTEAGDRSARDWAVCFERALEETLDTLSQAVQRRDPGAFELLIGGRAGVGGVYDVWRAMKARLKRKKFEPEHGRI